MFAWERFGFPGCIGSVDGSQVPLAYSPRSQTWTWWNRHDRYSMHVLVVSDQNRNIIAATLSSSGSASDAMVQQQADWARFPCERFSLREMLLGDKGMHYTDRVVGPYIGQRGQTTTNKNFASHLARLRGISEHPFGIVKGRWASLKERRLSIGSEEDFLAALGWILACCVLHNVCNSVNDGGVDPIPTLEAAQEPLPSHPSAGATRSGVKRGVIAFMKAAGVFK